MKHSFFAVVIVFALFALSSPAAPPEGGGIPFDGQTTYTVDAEKLGVDAKGFSVAVWARVEDPTGRANSMQIFVSLGETIFDGFKLYANNRSPGLVRMQVENAPSNKQAVGHSYQFAGAPLPEAGQWTHYLGTYDGRKIVVYRNGEKEAEKDAARNRECFDSKVLTLGALPAPGHNLTGALDEIRIWNTALDAGDAKRIFHGEDLPDALIAHWNAAGRKEDRLTNAVPGGPEARSGGGSVKTPTDSDAPAVSPFTIDGLPLASFDPQKDEFKYYLPFDAGETPKVEAAGGTVSKTDGGATVSIKSPAGETKTYKIMFEKLPELDLFFCIGQSNMAGRGPLKAELGDFEPVEGVYLFDSQDNWETAVNPLNKYSSVRKPMNVQQMSPPYSFVKKVSRATGRPIGLVMNPRGGTSIEEWTKGNKGQFNLYDEAVKRAQDAKKWGRYKAILWHQGEANSGRAGAYPEKLKRLVADLRSDLGDDRLFFVAGELGRWRRSATGKESNESFNTMLRGIASFLDHSACVSAEDLAPLNYNWNDPHFDRESLLLLGERYADAVLRHVYGAP